MEKKSPSTKRALVRKTASWVRAKKASASKNTFLSFLLDETGSMQRCIQSTISGFNEYVHSLTKAGHGQVAFTLVKFNSARTEIVHRAVPMKEVVALSEENYRPTASTPLYDAIGKIIGATEASVKHLRKGTNVLVVIMTDGEENSSQEFGRDKIFRLIAAKREEGWQFVFLGADQDAYKAASSIGVPKGGTMSYASRNTRQMYRTLTNATNRYTQRGRSSQDFFTADDLKKAGASTPSPEEEKPR